MNTKATELIDDYLLRLREAARVLPEAERRDLVADISEHIEVARASGTDSDAEVRTLLDRLGTPEDLVVAAGGSSGAGVPVAGAASKARLEPIAMVLLFVPQALILMSLPLISFIVLLFPLAFVCWLAGLVLVALSQRWDGPAKVSAALVVGAGFPVWCVAFAASVMTVRVSSSTCVQSGAAGEPLSDPVCTSSGGGFPWAGLVFLVLLVVFLVVEVRTARRLLRQAEGGLATR